MCTRVLKIKNGNSRHLEPTCVCLTARWQDEREEQTFTVCTLHFSNMNIDTPSQYETLQVDICFRDTIVPVAGFPAFLTSSLPHVVFWCIQVYISCILVERNANHNDDDDNNNNIKSNSRALNSVIGSEEKNCGSVRPLCALNDTVKRW